MSRTSKRSEICSRPDGVGKWISWLPLIPPTDIQFGTGSPEIANSKACYLFLKQFFMLFTHHSSNRSLKFIKYQTQLSCWVKQRCYYALEHVKNYVTLASDCFRKELSLFLPWAFNETYPSVMLTLFWNMTSWSMVNIYQRGGRTCCLNLQGKYLTQYTASHSRKQ
jgi:hypothetical protein